ncbi:PilW family protein [Tepidibacter aestuarii]|uniref:PilW family protein n=1 Tax=Tepidibacter aestuarii TaxID=2925782 RepID=UPI0020BF54B4|nr:type II secretion system protein [Tepidibacter aestuarii]CAH2214669.1 protein of unknown function [Tepidibacter aestuarii]
MIKCNKGLTLVELVVSLALLGIIIAPLSSFFVNTIKVNKNSENQMIANQLAQKYMEQLKFSKNIVFTDEEGELMEDKDYPNFRITQIVQEYEQNKKLVKITIKVKKKNSYNEVELVGLRKTD